MVNEQVAKHTRTVNDDINARTAQFSERNQFELVHPTERIRHRFTADHPEDLGEGFAVGLDVVGAPKDASDRLWIGSIVVALLTFDEAIDHDFGRLDGSFCRNRLRIKGVNIFPSRQYVWIPDGVAARSWNNVFAVQPRQQSTEFVIGHDLLQAKLQEFKLRLDCIAVYISIARSRQRFYPRRLLPRHAVEQVTQHRRFGHATFFILLRFDHGGYGLAGSDSDVVQQLHILQDAQIAVLVNVINVAIDAVRNDARQAEDALFFAIEAGNIHQGCNCLVSRWRFANDVQSAGQ